MNEEEIKEYLKRTDKLLDKLSGEDKDTLEWLIFGYNQCAKMLYEKENIIKEVREYIMTELITEWDIKNDGCVSGSDLPADAITPILEILGKVEE